MSATNESHEPTLLGLPDELIEKVQNDLVERGTARCQKGCGNTSRYYCFQPDEHLSGQHHLRNWALTCKKLYRIAKPEIHSHLRARDFNPYYGCLIHPNSISPGEDEFGNQWGLSDYDQVTEDLSNMFRHRQALTNIHAFSFDLAEKDFSCSYPTKLMADTFFELLLELNVSHLTLCLPTSKNKTMLFRRKVHRMKENSQSLSSIKSLTLGKHCHFIIEMCPNVEGIATYGSEWAFDTERAWPLTNSYTSVYRLLEEAAAAPNLKRLEVCTFWEDGMFEALRNLPQIKQLQHLTITGSLPLGTWMDTWSSTNPRQQLHERIVSHIETNINIFSKMTSLQTLVVPDDLPRHHIHSYDSTRDPADATHPLAFDKAQFANDWYVVEPDKDPLLWTDASYHREPHPEEKHVWDAAYTIIAEAFRALCPSLKFVWIEGLQPGSLRYRDKPIVSDVGVEFKYEREKYSGCTIKRNYLRPRLSDTPSTIASRDLSEKGRTDGLTKEHGLTADSG